MPTAAKLFAAIGFAIVAFFAAETLKPHMPEGTQFGVFSYICALIGALVGWLVQGPLAGRGFAAAMGTGVRCSVTIVFWALIVFSIYEMVLRSMKLRYKGPMDAVMGAFDLFLEYGKSLAQGDVLGVLLVGGLLAGILAEWAGRRWH